MKNNNENEMNSSEELQDSEEMMINIEEINRLKAELEQYKQLDSLNKLVKLQEETFILMYKRVITGDATSADIAAVINTLKHNDISIRQESEDELKRLAENLEKKRSKKKINQDDIDELKNVINFRKVGE